MQGGWESGHAGGLSLLNNTHFPSQKTDLKQHILRNMTIMLLTAEERLQAKQLDLLLALDKIGCRRVWSAGARPVHLTLAEAHRVDVVATDLQDQTSVHHVQQAAGEDPLLVVGDVFCSWEAQLLQADRPEQLLLVDHGAQVSVEQPAALRVADCDCGTHLLPPVLELHLQICH